MPNGRIVDFEAHYYTQEFLDTLAARTRLPTYDAKTRTLHHGGDCDLTFGPVLPELLELGDARVRDMDRNGISTAMLSFSIGIEQLEPELGVREARKNHDALRAVMDAYPGRFGGCAVLPVDDLDWSVHELERCAAMGFAGWNAFSNYNGRRLDDESLFPLLQKASELGLYVYLHPTMTQIPDLHGYGPGMVTSGLGFSVDVCITLTRMIMAGVFDRLPDLRVIIGHLGEGFSVYLQRLDDSMRAKSEGKAKNRKRPSEYFRRNIWVTTSGNFNAPAFRCAKEVLGMDRLLFGSDYPMETLERNIQFINSLNLTDDERERLLHGNAERAFGV